MEIFSQHCAVLFHQGQSVFAARYVLRHRAAGSVQPGELSICEQLHAADARVIYSGVNKTPVDIVRAVADGVGSYTAESLLQVRYLQEAALAAGKHLPVLFRLNAGSQFGMSKTDLFHALAHRAETPDLEFIGIQLCWGTQRKKLANQRKELAMLRELYAEIEQDLRPAPVGTGIRPRPVSAVF